jgi:hypothetical protein
VRSSPELLVAATPPDWKNPVPLIVEFAPPGAPVVRHDQDQPQIPRAGQRGAGTVCAIDEPSVVPAAFVVLMLGASVSAPVAAVVIRPPASMT